MKETESLALSNPEVRAVIASRLAGVCFTPLEKEVMFILADGEIHAVKDIVKALGGGPGKNDKVALAYHVLNIRKKVSHLGDDVLCVFNNRRTNYRYVLTLRSLLS